MAYPIVSTLAGTVKYNDGVTLLDGYVLLLIAFPSGYTQATIANQLIAQPIGDHIKVRIQQGVYDGSARIYQNASLEPPNTKYAAYFYDNNDTQLGHTSLFTIATSPYTITVPSFSVPTATGVLPSPGGGSSAPFLPTAYWYATTTPPDGQRSTFLFPFNPNIVVWNDTVKFPTTGFTSSFNGTSYVVSFTDINGNVLVPNPGDTIMEGV